MTNQQITLVKESWNAVGQLDPQLVGSIFYTRLLEQHPELRPMFRTPVPEQSRKLIAMLSYVIAKLDKLDEIIGEVGKLAQRHTAYGVVPEHYSYVGAALLYTLEKGLDALWTPELEAAWTRCYVVLSTAMIEDSGENALAEAV